MTDKTEAPERPVEPSDAERSGWPDTTMCYVEWLEENEDVAQAMVAAALERAAAIARTAAKANERRAMEFGGNEERRDDCIRAMSSDMTASSIATNIRALTPDDARAALDRLIAEAVAKEREACAKVADEWATGRKVP